MKLASLFAALLALGFFAAPAAAAAPTDQRGKDVPTKVEYYYRVKWGSLKKFIALYEKNHAPLLHEVQKDGFILDIKTEYPFTHLAAGPRWDMRVTIVYRDAAAAINDPEWESRWVEAKNRLYKDLKKFEAEEAERFSLLEEHWDVVISDYPG
ncbi:MAG: hypothetical protein A3E78_06145 [Alphaproteobacteria bacterium RIFCSPHIGHO2_12_FULL_63_12]|nr:MAG: hypothetical protein A3E78_06145 [Alphaproteobacteria bacterium RIFCSPHIGHO2_12_FULL_63_12]